MTEGREPTPQEKRDLIPPGGPPPTAVGAGTPMPEERPWGREGRGVEMLRSGLGLFIGLAATGIGALLAEITARRGTRSERH
jgi:hypothetical protein